MAEAQAQKAKRAASEALLHEEERVAKLLNESRCFYKNGDEQIGPVSFWRVRELIEMDLLTPDIQVIAEGSDYWRNPMRNGNSPPCRRAINRRSRS